MESKPVWKSKTVWANVLMGLGSLLSLGIFPPAAVAYLPLAQALVNIGLRVVTDQPVTVVPK